MDYLTDSATFQFNGKDRRLGVAIDNGHVIIFPRKGGLWDDLAVSAAVLAAVAVPIIGIPAGLAALGLSKAIDREKQEALGETIQKIRKKYKLEEADLLIANNETSSVTLSGTWLVIFGSTKVEITGKFASGQKAVDATISCSFDSSKSGLQKLFERNGYRVRIT